ncbi:hypothetical protein NA56DRAFT_646736 [Hyaloscypha hepaticicola]|uniref:Uncharacterized protein n=1 Tax=Hyaloscypha hepaticicola TaxID=2082293 RepID=A0A2J6Q0I9_9HELO|nr:hypothetical protein NA56DRAFT_646736 [Hyaloscypha hepaticicola]
MSSDKIKNTGSFTWLVPSSDPFIIPGEWVFALVNDATGATDAMVYLTIDPTTPPLCGPQTMDALSSEIASFQAMMTKNDGGGGPTGPGTTRTDASFLSIESELASLSSANAAKITKVMPHVLTTLGPSTTSGPGIETRVGQLGETQSGNLLSLTSKAGGGRAWGGESTAIWEVSSGMFGLFIGLLGVFL